jgi:tripartite-type tricarboxylate transporter receptor subunit TctC
MFSGRSSRLTMGKGVLLFWFCLCLVPAGSYAASREFPSKPINLLMSSSVAGSHDTSTRMLATPAEKLLGQPFIVTNKAEGGGTVAVSLLAREKGDGYHIGSCQSYNLTLMPHLLKVTYKIDDFAPIISFATIPSVIAVRVDSGWNTFKDFIEYAKKNPGKITYSLSGVNSMYYVCMETIRHKEGIKWTAMPYPSGNPYIPLLGGHVQATSSGPTVLPNVKSGELRVLAVMNPKRWKAMPEVPTLKELGYDFAEESLFAMIAPKATPAAIVNKFHDAFQKVLNDRGFVDYIEKMGMQVSYANQEQTKKYLLQSYDYFGRMVKMLNMTQEGGPK